MRTRHVQNLIIDTADRMTRQGQLAASIFLNQFVEAGITLHVVSLDLVVNDDQGVWAFLDAAYNAKQENKLRIRKSKRSKMSCARRGVYVRGNHAPYGYRYVAVVDDAAGNVTDKRMEPDERAYAERGFMTDFAASPYDARREILRLYADERWSFQKIANKLNDVCVPTAATLLKRTHAQGVWYARTVSCLINQPINSGRLVNHFSETDESPAQVIEVSSIYGNPVALVNARDRGVIALRRARNLETYYSRTSPLANRALLAGRLAKCGACGGTIVAKPCKHRGKDKTYVYYRCARHDRVRSSCPGLNLSAKEVDMWAWLKVMGAMAQLTETSPGGVAVSYTEVLTKMGTDRENAASAAGELSPAAAMANLKAARDKLTAQAANLTDSIRMTESKYVRATLVQDLERLEPEIQKADEAIAKAERQVQQYTQRVKLAADFLDRYEQYRDALMALDTRYEECIPIMRALLQSIGAQFTLDPDMFVKAQTQDSEPDIQVVITLTPQTALPWLAAEEIGRVVDERRERRIQPAQKELEAAMLLAAPLGSSSLA
jgi:hypothetical protein